MATRINEGTEERDVTLRIREGGIKEILTGIGPHGFFSLGSGRLQRLDDRLYITFCANSGKLTVKDKSIKALEFSISILLSDAENKFEPAYEEDNEEQKEDEPEATPETIEAEVENEGGIVP